MCFTHLIVIGMEYIVQDFSQMRIAYSGVSAEYDLLGDWRYADGKDFLGYAANRAWLDKTVKVGIDSPSIVYGCQKWDEKPTCAIDISKVDGKVQRGDVVGEMRYTDEYGDVIGKSDIVALASQEAPGILVSIGIGAFRFFAPVFGWDTMAKDDFEIGHASIVIEGGR